MEILTRAALGALLLGAAGCDLQRDPTPLALTGERVVVHSVLRTGADPVAVIIRRVAPPRGEGASASSLPLSGAAVRLRRGATEVALAEAGGGCAAAGDEAGGGAGCYGAALPGGVAAGAPHELRITLPGGGQVAGVSVPPAPPRLLRPAAGARFAVLGGTDPYAPLPGIPVHWEPGEGTAAVAVVLRPRAAFAGARRVDGARCRVQSYTGPYVAGTLRESGGPDSLVLVASSVDCLDERDGRVFPLDSVHAELVVAAYDTAYTRYARIFLRETAQVGSATAGLRGALGVFGGVAVDARPVTLVPAASAAPRPPEAAAARGRRRPVVAGAAAGGGTDVAQPTGPRGRPGAGRPALATRNQMRRAGPRE